MLYESNSCMPSNEWEYASVIVMKISGGLSCLGSGCIVQAVCKKWRRRRSSLDPYQRIMATMGAYDVLLSFFVFFMNTWMTPLKTGWWGAAGNVYTCSTQVFFFNLGYIGVSASQALLSTSSLLIVVHGWTPNKFERKVEHRMHVVIFAAATAVALLLLSTKTYIPSCIGCCWVIPAPISCFPLSPVYDDGAECVRESLTIAPVIRLFGTGVLVLVAVYYAVAMYAIYRNVRNV